MLTRICVIYKQQDLQKRCFINILMYSFIFLIKSMKQTYKTMVKSHILFYLFTLNSSQKTPQTKFYKLNPQCSESEALTFKSYCSASNQIKMMKMKQHYKKDKGVKLMCSTIKFIHDHFQDPLLICFSCFVVSLVKGYLCLYI